MERSLGHAEEGAWDGQGKPTPVACRDAGISQQNYAMNAQLSRRLANFLKNGVPWSTTVSCTVTAGTIPHMHEFK